MDYFDTLNWVLVAGAKPVVTASTGMTGADWVKLIGGAILGSGITAGVTTFNTNRQFKYQREKDLLQKKEGQLIALKSVENEIFYNLKRLEFFKEKLEEKELDKVSFKELDLNNNLKNDSWLKHSDTIDSMNDLKKVTDKLHIFYFNLANEINNQIVQLKRTEDLIIQGNKIKTHIEFTTKKQNLSNYITNYYESKKQKKAENLGGG
ncbi:hypothetical protein [Priestia megaterium]|uniref:hypothetical protein n=1 Tax=Priestia megaterium TaxID=1404 RepID=UPI00263B178B|nr:hypothetical protein [Priestia megaterium]MDN4862889.1 hypothetical protein [Priestia megaterium]